MTALLLISASAEVMIHEIMYYPASEGTEPEPIELEYVELYNDSDEAVTLTEWAVLGGIRLTLPEITLPGKGYGIVAADPNAFVDHYGNIGVPVMGPWEGDLDNLGDRIQLVDASGEVIDEVDYATEGDWGNRRKGPEDHGHEGWIWETNHRGEGSSLELRCADLRNDSGQNWGSSPDQGGSPGRANGLAVEVAAPLIGEVRHDPPIPSSSDTVRIQARLLDQLSEDATMTLFFRVSAPPDPYGGEPKGFSALLMMDDGQSGDLGAGDKVYGIEIPPHPAGTVIEFYVEASDGELTRTWPAPSDEEGSQGANALYQVDDEPRHPTQADYRFVLSVPEQLFFRPGQGFNPNSSAAMNATFIAEVEGKTEIRYQTNLGLWPNLEKGPKILRVSVPDDRPWLGMTDLHLNVRFSFLQMLGWSLMKEASLKVPEVRNVQVRINGINETDDANHSGNYGAYVHVEPLNEDFLRRAYPDDAEGNLYRKQDLPDASSNRWGVDGNDAYLTPEWYRDDHWTKESNAAADDWSDFQSFIVAINEASDEEYFEIISDQVNIDQWVRWFAVNRIMSTARPNLSRGYDSDYLMYRSESDPRFVLFSSVMDSIFGMGVGVSDANPETSIFSMTETGFPQLERFFEHPKVRTAYLSVIRELLSGVYHPDRFESFVNQVIGHVSETRRNQMISYMKARRSYILGQLDEFETFLVTDSYPVMNGYPTTENSTASLSGVFPIVDGASVWVQGISAGLSLNDGVWQIDEVPLFPGINRLLIELRDLDGVVIDTTEIDLWRDIGSESVISGSIEGDVTWVASEGPYMITDDLVVESRASLTIEPGTSVFLEEGVRILVEGTLIAIGEPYARIRFTGVPTSLLVPDLPGIPNGKPKWGGIHWRNSSSDDNEVSYVDIDYAQHPEGSVGAVDSRVGLNHVTFAHTYLHPIVLERSSLHASSCRFPRIFTGTEDPEVLGLQEQSDQIRSLAYPSSGEIVIEGSTFAAQRGRNAHIRLDGEASESVQVSIRDNEFSGAETVGIDLEAATSVISGNTFVQSKGLGNVPAAALRLRDGSAWVFRNVFSEMDRAVALEGSVEAIIEYNTLHRLNRDRSGTIHAAIHIEEESAPSLYLGNNLFSAVGVPFSGLERLALSVENFQLTHNLFPRDLADFPIGDSTLAEWSRDSIFVDETGLRDPDRGDFRLVNGAVASVGGWGGHTLGSEAQNLLLRSSQPSLTSSASVQFTVGGPGVRAIQYRINEGEWNESIPVGEGFDPDGTTRQAMFSLSELEGEYVLEVRGQTAFGEWQTGKEFDWTVSPLLSPLRINEVLALNDSYPSDEGEYSALVEVYNAGAVALNLDEYTSSNDSEDPDRYAFPAGETLEAGAYGVLSVSLDGHGDSVILYHEGEMIDEVAFGPQIVDFSLARTDEGHWRLGSPTFGSANEFVAFGDATDVVINEWYASRDFRFTSEFVELYHPGSLPATLEGLSVRFDSERYHFPENSYIPAKGFVTLAPNPDNLLSGGVEIDLQAASGFESITLENDYGQLDLVAAQREDVKHSWGRIPDGSDRIESMVVSTPGMSNGAVDGAVTESLVEWDGVWTYHDLDEDPGTAWRDVGYDDSHWESAQGLFGTQNVHMSPPIRTVLEVDPPMTHYFRHQWTMDSIEDISQWDLELAYDDGMVLYLNGQEILRLGMPGGSVNHDTRASQQVGTATTIGPFGDVRNLFVEGENVLAASVHQHANSGDDVVFGIRMTADRPGVSDPMVMKMKDLLDYLRITEVMYAPEGNPDAEWIDLTNTGPIPLDLEGVRFIEGVEFVFPEMTLEAGASLVVVADRESFETVYGEGIRIAGEYTGRLHDEGARLALALPDPYEAAIVRLTYASDWYSAASGGGASLVVREPSLGYTDNEAGWRLGSRNGGTPAAPEVEMISDRSLVRVLNETFDYEIETTAPVDEFGGTGLPEGLSLDPERGVISGSAREFGTFNVRLSGQGDAGAFTSNLFLEILAVGPPHHFDLTLFPTSMVVGRRHDMTVTIQDKGGNRVRDYRGSPKIGIRARTGWRAEILITEVQDSEPRFVEIRNLSTNTIDTSEYVLMLNDASGGFDAVHGREGVPGNVWSFPPEMAPGEIIVVREGDEGMDFEFGWEAESDAEHAGRGWVAVARDTYFIDRVVWGYPLEETRMKMFILDSDRFFRREEDWLDQGVVHQGGGNRSLQRIGDIDTNRTEGWAWADPTPGADHPDMKVPMVLENTIEVQTGIYEFVEGQWNGFIKFVSEQTDVRLMMYDESVNTILTEPFTIESREPIQMTSPTYVELHHGEELEYLVTANSDIHSIEVFHLPEGLTFDPETRMISGSTHIHERSYVSIRFQTSEGELPASLAIDSVPDSDGDGISDYWEAQYGLDPENPDDALLDHDGDGRNALEEHRAGTDLFDPASRFEIQSIEWNAEGDLQLSWHGIAGKAYRVWMGSPSETGIEWERVGLPRFDALDDGDLTATISRDTIALKQHPYFRVEVMRHGGLP